MSAVFFWHLYVFAIVLVFMAFCVAVGSVFCSVCSVLTVEGGARTDLSVSVAVSPAFPPSPPQVLGYLSGGLSYLVTCLFIFLFFFLPLSKK